MSLYPFDFMLLQVSDGDLKQALWIEENVASDEVYKWLFMKAHLAKLQTKE